MKKVFSLCLAVLLLFGMMPMDTMATETENESMQEIADAIKKNSKAEIRDADGKVLETLNIDVQVQQINTSRSTDGNEYLITCTASSEASEWPDYDSADGISGTLLMVCRDEWGTSNTLISVTGNWSGEDSDTENRTVTYCYYDVYNIQSPVVKDNNAPRQFEYYPVDYKGFTFKATSKAQIASTDRWLYLEAATDASVLDQQ